MPPRGEIGFAERRVDARMIEMVLRRRHLPTIDREVDRPLKRAREPEAVASVCGNRQRGLEGARCGRVDDARGVAGGQPAVRECGRA